MGVDIQTYRSRVGCFTSRRGAGVMPSFIDNSILVKCVRVTFLIRLLFIMFGIEPDPGTIELSIGVEQYGCSVRCFVSCSGAGEMAFTIDFSKLVKLVGVVFFIRTLLIMAGIEQNPGPVVPPTIVSDIKDQFAMCGKPWELNIDIGGDVHVEVKVEKDNIQLPENDHMKITSCNNVVTLSINDVKEEDSGEYKLEVSNDGGSATCTFKLVDQKYNFRYQYVLIEIGTKVLRKLFDSKVGHDFSKYLAANTNQSKALQLLITPKKKGMKPTLTSEQAKLLPPLDNNPMSSNFDITLLSCLLRNVCGLKSLSDIVWTTPAPTDLSVEADITRLRQCRNHLSHGGTVLFPATEFSNKWTELTDILLRLNAFCGKECITDLATIIDTSKDIDIDDGLTDHLIDVIKQWYSYEQDLIGDVARLETIATTTLAITTTVMKEQQGITKRLDNVEQIMTEQRGIKRQLDELVQINKRQNDDSSVIQQKLITIYQRDCRLLQVSPIFEDDTEELMAMYQTPTLHHAVFDKDQTKGAPILSYKQIFCKGEKTFKRVYISGDAGVGKTSLCRRMCLLWSMSRLGSYTGNDKDTKRDILFLEKFDFLFYVSLGATDRRDIIMMIIDQLFYTERDNERTSMYELIKHILNQRESLIVLDGFDEWTPKTSGRFDSKTPKGIESEKCVFLTTCRPYKLEHVRLSVNDIEHQVEMTGIHGLSAEHYVTEVVKHMNKTNNDKKNPDFFMQEINRCGLYDHLCIPMVSSHLIVVWWFDQKLTHVSKAFLYCKMLEMLFKRAKSKVDFPPSTLCELRLPDYFSELEFLHEQGSLLQKVCLLSFNSLFKQDTCASTLIFTKRQLMASPYFLTTDETDFVCKVGILSINKVIGCFEERRQILSFMHKSYIELLSAIYVLSFDSCNMIDSIVKKWKSLDDVLQYQNFFQFLAGLSGHNLNIVLESMYKYLSDHLHLRRKYAIFDNRKGTVLSVTNSYHKQLKLLQTIVVSCFVECNRSNDKNVYLKLEDFIFDENSNVEILKQLLSLNTTCVKYLYAVKGTYHDVFDKIENLQVLHVGKNLLGDIVKFTNCMLRNQTTLHTVCIRGEMNGTVLTELPVRSLHHLTSLSLSDVHMQHESLQDLLKFLSDNVLIENLKLASVYCDKHNGLGGCTPSLSLLKHTNLTSLCLWYTSYQIDCAKVNNSSLKCITFHPATITRSPINYEAIKSFFYCIKNSQVEHIYINGRDLRDKETMSTFMDTVQTLSCIKSLRLEYVNFFDDILLQLHSDAKKVEIKLCYVQMRRKCFHWFIESIKEKSEIKVVIIDCEIDGETHQKLTRGKSVEYMSEYLESMQTINITRKDSKWSRIHFETNCP